MILQAPQTSHPRCGHLADPHFDASVAATVPSPRVCRHPAVPSPCRIRRIAVRATLPLVVVCGSTASDAGVTLISRWCFRGHTYSGCFLIYDPSRSLDQCASGRQRFGLVAAQEICHAEKSRADESEAIAFDPHSSPHGAEAEHARSVSSHCVSS